MTPAEIRELVYRETCPEGCGKGLPICLDTGNHMVSRENGGTFIPCTRNTALAEKVVEVLASEREACAVELESPYPEDIFPPLRSEERIRIMRDLDDGISDRLHAAWARHWAAAIRARGVEMVAKEREGGEQGKPRGAKEKRT